MKRKVAIYARVSTEHEAQLSALDNQVQYYDNILAQHPDWELYKRYIDEGITGTSVKKRKNFTKMIEDAENGCFDLIITREVSRFARNTVDTLQETRKLKKIGVEVYFTEDNIWTFNDDDGELKLTIMATLAQNESKKISQRVKSGQMISFQNGVFYGTGNILGYDKVGKEMIINEEQAEIVKFIYSSFLQGQGTSTIKYELEKRGCLTATGLTRWNTSTITRILKNSFYCGTIVYRKVFVGDYLEQKKIRNTGQVEKVVVEGRHKPIISKEDFEKVQEIINKRAIKIQENTKKGINSPKNIWGKKLKCQCGSSFNRKVYHKNGDDISYCFQCYKQKNIGSLKVRLKKGLNIEDSCNIPILQEWKLDLMASVIFNLIWNDKEKIINMANKLIDEFIDKEDNNSEYEEEIKSLNKKIEINNDKMNKLIDMYLNNTINKDKYFEKKIQIENNSKAFIQRKEEIESVMDVPKNSLEIKLKGLKQSIIDNLNYNENKVSDSMIDTFVDEIIVKEDKFEWRFNFISGFNDSNEYTINIEKGVLLTSINITQDDAIDFFEKQGIFKKYNKIIEPIKVDIYI